MNDETLAALERAAIYAEQRRNSLLSDMEALSTEEAIELGRFALMHGKDAALIRAHIETLRAGGERAQIVALTSERDALAGIVRGWHWLAVGPDEMGDYLHQRELIKASEPYASPALQAIVAGAHIEEQP